MSERIGGDLESSVVEIRVGKTAQTSVSKLPMAQVATTTSTAVVFPGIRIVAGPAGELDIENRLLAAARRLAEQPIHVLSTAVHGLLRTRDFLTLQLDHEFGNTSDEEFETGAKVHLAAVRVYSREELDNAVHVRLHCLDETVDPEAVSVMLGTNIEDVEDAFQRLARSE